MRGAAMVAVVEATLVLVKVLGLWALPAEETAPPDPTKLLLVGLKAETSLPELIALWAARK